MFSVSVVPQKTGEGLTGPEEGEGGDPAAGDGESKPGANLHSNPVSLILTASVVLSGTAGAPAER